jgi:hypothetical protein
MDVAALREHFSYFAGFGGLGASNGRNQFFAWAATVCPCPVASPRSIILDGYGLDRSLTGIPYNNTSNTQYTRVRV